MPIVIDEMQTDVQVAPLAPAATPPASTAEWQLIAQARALQRQQRIDDARTAAFGNDNDD